MKKIFQLLIKYLVLFLIGGFVYISIELLWRGHTHWSMFILGGVCFILLGLINEIIPWEVPLWQQMTIGSIIITILEFITGLIVNIHFDLHVWNYSDMPLNFMGQICLPFSILWFFISLIGITLDDFIRWKFFNEEKPRYTMF